MEFGPIFAAIRRRWWILAVTLVVGILAAVVVNAATPRQYTATARLFVAATGGTSSTESYSGEQFSQQRTASYAHMIVTEQVAQRVVDKLKLQMSAKKLSSKVRAAIVPRTVLLDVSATDRSPEDAAAIANTLADSFIEFAGPLETPVGQNAPRSTITVVSRADVPTAASTPKVRRNLLYGVVGGLGLGLVVIGLFAAFLRRIGSADELGRITGTAALGPINTADRHPKGWRNRPAGLNVRSTEDFRRLRVQIEAHDTAPQVVLVVSASPDDSATTFAVDLAVAFCEAGRKTTLIAADRELESLAPSLGSKDRVPGLAEVLEGESSFEEAIHQTASSNLSVVPPGKTSDIESLLSSPRMSGFIDNLRKECDRIVILTASVNSSSAASVLSAIVDANLLVVNPKKALRWHVDKAMGEFEAARACILGAVLVNS